MMVCRIFSSGHRWYLVQNVIPQLCNWLLAFRDKGKEKFVIVDYQNAFD
jgi:hypothetical protein